MTRMAKKGWLEVEKEGNTNYYTPAIAQKKALKEEIQRFLDEVVGAEPENRQLLEKILAQDARKKGRELKPEGIGDCFRPG